MKKIALFDFDGTLYPFTPYDSEDLLIILSARNPEEKALAEDVRIRDEHSQISSDEIYQVEQKLVVGHGVEIADIDAEYLSKGAGENFLKPLRKLKDAGFELYVISCGFADIAQRYLKLQGVDDIFSGIYGKHLVVSNGKITGIDFSEISCGEDKKKKALELIKNAGECTSVSVGDGLTDLPIFSVTDKAVFIDHGFTPFVQVASILDAGYPITKTVEELVNFILKNC